ncbi:MAG: type II toxin-antitoxin system VapB family antitoxin [Azoarcus sp.]|nr:type II toxin-antitoxin system VapB family antitoxin [Azoarcus sp.]
MTIMIEDAQMERLAESIAAADGVSVAEVMRAGLLSLAEMRGLTPHRAPLRQRLAKLTQEIDAIPPQTPHDTRSDNEVLGYKEYGAW